MPIPVCKFGRGAFKKTYFGFKFHALASIDGFITDFIIILAT